MCNTCRYVRRTRQDQYACFGCRCTKSISRRALRKPKEFYFLADGKPYVYKQRFEGLGGVPSCSYCASKMLYVGPHFRGPPRRKVKQWEYCRFLLSGRI